MKEKKNIDRLFQEKFKDFEKEPPEEAWKNIEKELAGQKKKKPMVALPLWAKIAGVAALIAVLFLLGNTLFFSTPRETSGEQPIRQTSSFEEIQAKPDKALVQSGSEEKKNDAKEISESGREAQNNGTKSIPESSEKAGANRGNEGVARSEATERNGSSVRNHRLHHANTEARETFSAKRRQKSVYNQARKERGAKNKVAKARGALEQKSTVEGESKSKAYKQKQPIKGADKKEQATLMAKVEHKKSVASSRREKGVEKDLENNRKQEAPENAELTQNTPAGKQSSDSSGTGKRSIFADIGKEKSENTAAQKQEDAVHRIAFKPTFAPIYYSSLSGGSTLDSRFSDNHSKGEVTMSVGVNISYALTDRLKIRSGINKVNMSYNTENIAFTSSPQAKHLTGLSRNAVNRNLLIVSAKRKPKKSLEVPEKSLAPYTRGKLNQEMVYIEIPFEMEYALVDRRFSISVIGGASTLFLSDDAVRINSAEGTTELGHANNINRLSFTTNLGLGFGYRLNDRLQFSVEPTFKYQFDGYSGKTSDFHPYYLGVYSGISFRF